MTTQVLIVGDSTVATWYHNQHTSQDGMDDVLRDLLGSAYEVVSVARGGSAIAEARSAAAAAMAHKIRDIVVIASGTNDVAASATAASIIASEAAIRTDAVFFGSSPTVFTCTIPPVSTWSGAQQTIRTDVNTSWRASYTSTLIERDGLLRDPTTTTQLATQYLISGEPADVTHVNTFGNQGFASLVAARILAL